MTEKAEMRFRFVILWIQFFFATLILLSNLQETSSKPQMRLSRKGYDYSIQIIRKQIFSTYYPQAIQVIPKFYSENPFSFDHTVSQSLLKGKVNIDLSSKGKGKGCIGYLNNQPWKFFLNKEKSLVRNIHTPRIFSSCNGLNEKKFIFPDIHVIGLTGGIAAGKSTACEFLKSKGLSVIDADKLGHAAYLPGSDGYEKITKCFGFDNIVNIEDGTIDRAKLGAIVFCDKKKMKDLTDIIWPIVTEMAKFKIRELSSQGIKCVVVEAAILFEASWDTSLVDEVWCLGIPEEVAIKRLIKRNNFTEDQALQRIRSQLDNTSRKEKSLVYIDSSGEKEVTRQFLEKEYQNLKVRLKESRGFKDEF